MKALTVRRLTVVAVLAFGATLAQAEGPEVVTVATLAQVQGTVMVNQGKDYVNAHAGTVLRAGSRVLTMDKSSATIVYGDECTKELKPNSLLVVRGTSDCTAATAPKSIGPMYAEAIGSGSVKDAGGGIGSGADTGGGSFWNNALIVGGVLGGGALIYNSTRNSRSVSGQ